MKKKLFFCLTNLMCMIWGVAAQVPTPVINNEIRDNSSIRSREIELERVKRDSRKSKLPAATNERIIKFPEIKEDFEKIQNLQNSIIKVYANGKKNRYKDIGKFALNINKSALRLRSNLFTASVTEKPEIVQEEKDETRKSVEEIIVDLDNEIGNFTKSAMFQNLKVIDTKVSESAENTLQQIIELSSALNQKANNIKIE